MDTTTKVEQIKDIEDETKPEKLPQIVIIVDEVLILMVAPGEVKLQSAVWHSWQERQAFI